MGRVTRNCKVTGGEITRIEGIEEKGDFWIFENEDPQMYIQYTEPVWGIEFSCEIGRAEEAVQPFTIYYRREEEGFSEKQAYRVELLEQKRTKREIRFGFPVCEIRLDPAEHEGQCEVLHMEVAGMAEDDTVEKSLGKWLSGKCKKSANKIAVLSHDLSKTGAPILAYNIAVGFKKRGWDVVVLAGCLGNGFMEKKYEVSQIPLIILEKPATGEFAYINLNGNMASGELPFIETVAKTLKNQGYETILANTVVSGAYVETLKDYGMKIVSLIHEMKTSIRFYGFTQAGGNIANHADYVVFPNSFAQADFRQLFSEVKGKCLIRPQGIYLDKKTEVEAGNLQELELPEKARIILGSGSCELRKGIDLFVSTAVMFLNRYKEDVHFVWTGDFLSKELKCWMMDHIERSGHADRIHFIPFIQEERLYKAVLDHTEVFWGMSREDPFPSTVLEAMEYEIPVVGFSGTGGIQTMLEKERGILINHMDLEECVRQTKWLLSDEGIKKKIVANAKGYTKSLGFNEYIDFLEETVKREMLIHPPMELHIRDEEQNRVESPRKKVSDL